MFKTGIADNTSDQFDPAIYGNKVVWTDNRNGGYDIYMQNLSTKVQTRITTGETAPDHAIYDNRIVYRNFSGEHHDMVNIYMYDLSTKKETQIITSRKGIYNPAIYGDRIVWEDSRNDDGTGNTDIYMYDLSTKQETRITPSYEGGDNNPYQSNPSIYGDKIVWEDWRNGNADIYMYDLSTNKETQITTNKSEQRSPVIYGNTIVWQDNRNGNADIYMFTLASAEVPTPDGNETDDGNGTSNGTGNGTQVPDNNSDNGPGNGTGNGTQVPDNNSDNGTSNGTGNGTQVPDNNSDNGAGNGTGNGTQVPDNCSAKLMPLDNMQALKEYVECTYECHENTKIGLASLLDTSMCYCENGEDEKAVSMLNSFIHLAEKMKECQQVSADEADYMVREAKKIIDQIEAN
ncbi:cell surface protein [Methanosarcina lacustris Z-7289]|uniref:Cell surface protein n=1 Tax=Methanosarcina lacustris Z-7289 TaxID=1434111 RepID=A0A0E3S6L9_9EURY|nr:hypothetical protein [Methanosarcina lacustris]AKB74937.1 cell surface protein [Methanosarcina lacustris Z-7289]